MALAPIIEVWCEKHHRFHRAKKITGENQYNEICTGTVVHVRRYNSGERGVKQWEGRKVTK